MLIISFKQPDLKEHLKYGYIAVASFPLNLYPRKIFTLNLSVVLYSSSKFRMIDFE